MAISKNGINGSLSGKVGNVVFCKKYGINYARSLPRKNRKKIVSESLASNRSRFKFMQQHVTKLLPVARIGFDYSSVNRSAYNSAMSYNLKSALISTEEGFKMNWEEFAFSRDISNPIYDIKLFQDEETETIHVEWQTDSEFLGKENSELFRCVLMIYPEDIEKSDLNFVLYGNSIQMGKQAILHKKSGEVYFYHVYIAFFSIDVSNRVTNSEYVGRIAW